jgi:hypothetical protein
MADKMLDGYIDCALWSTHDYHDSDDTPLDRHYGPEDISPECLAQMRADCEAFTEANSEDIAYFCEHVGCDDGQVGHGFWLDRESHGAGFKDFLPSRDEKFAAAVVRLYAAAKDYGPFDEELNRGIVRDD